VRAPVVVASGLVVIAVAGAAWFLTRPSAPVAEAPREVAPRAAPPVTPEIAPAPAPAAGAPSRATPRAPTPRPSAPAAAVEPIAEAPTTGTLRIETDVPDALVLFDRIGVGDAPVTIPNVAPGQHQLNVSARGYDSYSETIDVQPGERVIRISFKEVRLEARLNAVHKHGMGSCRGVLTATPQGIQFTAADGKDNFTVTMADIQGFDVDYLAKNLRIRVRQGRTYNFGDPEDNADRLFVFHRDVDKARQRLLTGQ
jgi:hypothetical protein